MGSVVPIQRALISVSNKTGIVDFAKVLVSYGVEIISTGGTSHVLEQAGIEVTAVEKITGFPEMLDGRVKTLHPSIHGGLLGVRTDPSHIKAMEDHGIVPIDLICIDLYPFETTIAIDNVTDAEAIEQIDIGGPAMIRSAAKNFRFVTVVTDPKHFALVLADLEANQGGTTFELRNDLARDAFSKTADYDTAISQWMLRDSDRFPSDLRLCGKLEQALRYGENPHQSAAVYRDMNHTGPNVVTASVVAGKPLSYNNLMDASSALELVQDLTTATQQPTAVIIKHANPCCAAVSPLITDAFLHAWKCDPLAAFGGIVALSEDVDIDLAHIITQGEKFLEVIVAPSFTKESIEALSNRWKNIRLLTVGNEPRQKSWSRTRSIQGGMLVQDGVPMTASPESWDHVAGPALQASQSLDAIVGWITCGHLKSNAISIVEHGALIGGGMGQVDRLSAARLAVQRAGQNLIRAVFPIAASDAFFPFPDGPQLLIDAGIKCIIQPGGSVRDHETIELCESRNITLMHTGSRCFRH